MTTETTEGRILKATDTQITLEWDGCYSGEGNVITVDGIDYTLAGVSFRGPTDSGFVSRGWAWTPLYFEREAAKRAEEKARDDRLCASHPELEIGASDEDDR